MSIPTDLIGGQLKPVVCRNANRKRILRERETAASTKDTGGPRKAGTCPPPTQAILIGQCGFLEKLLLI